MVFKLYNNGPSLNLCNNIEAIQTFKPDRALTLKLTENRRMGTSPITKMPVAGAIYVLLTNLLVGLRYKFPNNRNIGL
uniref:Uncharacterized protein n=1 Tax=Arundo donax TaxID=35708 RepID=A0A0A8Y7F3_ARUDO